MLAGYGFSRFHFPLKNVLFVLIIVDDMIPFQSILTPLFLILTKLGLQQLRCPGWCCVYVTLQLPFSIFMMRNAFDAVPSEIEEAARMDGANSHRRCSPGSCCRWCCPASRPLRSLPSSTPGTSSSPRWC